jgi:predicted ATPase
MRVAFSGSHRTGKTTLIEALADALPGYAVLDEPYRVLEDDGHEFSDPPCAEDFVVQLERSIELIEDAPARTLIDRCPLDFVAYLRVLDADDDLERAMQALERLDLIVHVPIEEPDRIAVPSHEDRTLRRAVDDVLAQLLADSEVDVLEVRGTLAERAELVMHALSAT